MSQVKEYYQQLHDSIPAGHSYWKFYDGDSLFDEGVFTKLEAFELARNAIISHTVYCIEVENLFPDLTDDLFDPNITDLESYYRDIHDVMDRYTLMAAD